MSVLINSNTLSQMFLGILKLPISELVRSYSKISLKQRKANSSLINPNFLLYISFFQNNHVIEESKKFGQRKQATFPPKISMFHKATFSKDLRRFLNDKNKYNNKLTVILSLERLNKNLILLGFSKFWKLTCFF